MRRLLQVRILSIAPKSYKGGKRMSKETKQSSGIEFQKDLLNTIMRNAKPTFVDDALRSQAKVEDAIKDSVVVNDAYGNKLLSIGADDKVESFTSYGLDNDTLNWTLWLILYSSSWVFKRAIDKPAQDEVRCGITLQGGN